MMLLAPGALLSLCVTVFMLHLQDQAAQLGLTHMQPGTAASSLIISDDSPRWLIAQSADSPIAMPEQSPTFRMKV
jgi:hypothetical protein